MTPLMVTEPPDNIASPMPPFTAVGARRLTSPVIVPADVEVTVAITVAAVPCLIWGGVALPFTVRLVIVAWKVPAVVGHCVARLATFTEPRPVAKSYPAVAVHAGVVADAGLTRTPLVPGVMLLQFGEVPAGEFAAHGTESLPLVTSLNTQPAGAGTVGFVRRLELHELLAVCAIL